MSHKRLIVNADDFGLCGGVNAGIIRCFETGIVTSTSLMVRWAGAAEAAAYARANPRLAVGLHVDLGEWSLREGEWVPLYERVPSGRADEIEREITGQLEEFRRLVGREPTHVDSHQHVHRDEPTRSVVLEIARPLGVPVRHESAVVTHRGSFYGQDKDGLPHGQWIGLESLRALLAGVTEGVSEMNCHPGLSVEVETMYGGRERAIEVTTLCDQRAREAVAEFGVELCSFADVARSG
jgi:predicted glycoside hydrolase/deacetylase ChbG (UPF0249 family)